ncbi:MAG: hypothetical protein ACI9JN_000229 [Bacteroidia bacterium]|jgi:hypothetical protein
MRHYLVKESSDEDVGKTYPQSQKIILPKGKTVKDPAFVWNVQFCKIPDFEPILGTIKVENSAKLTDLISSSTISNGYIISKKLFKILGDFNLGNFIQKPVTVKFKGDYFEYYWVHIANDKSTMIDFNNSNFYLIDSFSNKDSCSIKNWDELVQIRKSASSLKKIRFDKMQIGEFLEDCFHLNHIFYDLIISERLKNAILKNGVTGINFQNIDGWNHP